MVLEARGTDRPALRYRLDPARPALIGRADAADIRVEDDPHVSREHATVRLDHGILRVTAVPGAANPIFHAGSSAAEFALEPGGHFVIGRTRFVLVDEPDPGSLPVDDAPLTRLTLDAAGMQDGEGGADRIRLLDLLELPEILRSQAPPEYFLHLAGLLRLATGAREVCVLSEAGHLLARDAVTPARSPAPFSRSLIREALATQPRPTMYSWANPDPGMAATPLEGIDWAICAAFRAAEDVSILFYVSGHDEERPFGDRNLRERARFTGLVADMIGRTLAIQRLELRQQRLQHYFSNAVIAKIVATSDPKELEPRLAESTVMFFDLRGFSKKTEGRNDRILAYSGELRRVMTAMTEQIFKEQGVVLQYLGDGILACWNVPLPDPGHVDRACRAALAMVAALEREGGSWHCGIGVHTGEVVAGSLGSDQVFSYTVMGDVVNRTSRIQGITKIVETPVLVSREVAEVVSADVAVPMRVGRFQPAGMTVPVDLFELTAPPADAVRVSTFERGLALFEHGDWEQAYEMLSALGPHDRPARNLMALAEAHRRRPPKAWSGVIELEEK